MAQRENQYNIKEYAASFGLHKHFYVSSGNPLINIETRTIQILEAVAGLSMEDSLSINGSSAIPASLPVGIQLNGAFTNISVSSGVILCILP